jgi:hypothetical protein
VGTRSLDEPRNCLKYMDITRYHEHVAQRLGVEGRRFIITCEELLSQHSTKPGRRSPTDLFIPCHPVQPITANLRYEFSAGSLSRLRESYQNTPNMQLSLAASAPDILQQTISLRQSVQGIITLPHGSYKSAKSVDLTFACEPTVLVNLSDGDLDGRVILGLDYAVGGTALARDVAKKMVRISFNSYLLEGHCIVAFRALEGRTGRRVHPYRSPSWRFLACKLLRSLVV